MKTRAIDLLDLHPNSDVDVLVNLICQREPLITDKRKPQIKQLIESQLMGDVDMCVHQQWNVMSCGIG